MLLAFHKPYGVLSQFSESESEFRPLADFGFPKGVYPLGRLDADSEGLLLLSDEGWMNARLLHPRARHRKEYWAQVERVPAEADLARLAAGVVIQGRKTLPCRAWSLEPQPDVPPRVPPIRHRAAITTCWIALELAEGRNRQVRRMTAAIGFPTLRLIRVRIGGFYLEDLPPGAWRELGKPETELVFASRI